MKGCNHDRVYSGQTNMERKFAFICKTCGECDWSETYEMHRVNFDEYCRQRVIHGWNSERTSTASARRAVRLSPVPPRPERLRLPTQSRARAPQGQWLLVAGMGYFMFLTTVCLLMATPWWHHESPMPTWVALGAAATALFTVAMLYAVWRSTNG